MNEDWPKTVKVSGREYEIGPDISMSDFFEVNQSLLNEVEKLAELSDALGLKDPGFKERKKKWDRLFDDDDEY